MKLILIGLILISTAAQANCDLYIPDVLALNDGDKKDEKVVDQNLLKLLESKGYNPILLRTLKRPTKTGLMLNFDKKIVEKPAFLKRGQAALHLKMIDQATKKTTYSHIHGVSCKFKIRKDQVRFEKDCMEILKTEIEFIPACGE